MPPEPPGTRPPKGLSLVVQSGDADRLHYAVVMAAAAAAVDVRVTLFFTMGGCRALLKATPQDLRDQDADFAAKGIGTFEELLSASAEMGARIWVCEMGLVAAGIPAMDLRDDIGVTVTGLVSFLMDAGPEAQIVYV